MMPQSRSRRPIVLPISANMVEPPEGAPPVRQAFSETTKASSKSSRPWRISSAMTSAVMILAIEAGTISSSAFFENSTVPVVWSTRIACSATVVNCAAAGLTAAGRRTTIPTATQRIARSASRAVRTMPDTVRTPSRHCFQTRDGRALCATRAAKSIAARVETRDRGRRLRAAGALSGAAMRRPAPGPRRRGPCA